MKFEHFLLLVGGLGGISIACGCFGLYQYFAYERKRKLKPKIRKIRTFREMYEDNEYVTEEVWYEKAR